MRGYDIEHIIIVTGGMVVQTHYEQLSAVHCVMPRNIYTNHNSLHRNFIKVLVNMGTLFAPMYLLKLVYSLEYQLINSNVSKLIKHPSLFLMNKNNKVGQMSVLLTNLLNKS